MIGFIPCMIWYAGNEIKLMELIGDSLSLKETTFADISTAVRVEF